MVEWFCKNPEDWDVIEPVGNSLEVEVWKYSLVRAGWVECDCIVCKRLVVWYETCGWCMVHGGMALRTWWVGVLVWFGMMLGWCMVWWHGWQEPGGWVCWYGMVWYRFGTP